MIWGARVSFGPAHVTAANPCTELAAMADIHSAAAAARRRGAIGITLAGSGGLSHLLQSASYTSKPRRFSLSYW